MAKKRTEIDGVILEVPCKRVGPYTFQLDVRALVQFVDAMRQKEKHDEVNVIWPNDQ